MAKVILRLPVLCERIGLQRSSIYDRLNPKSKRFDPMFPKPISLGPRAIGFIEDEVEDWVNGRIEQSRKAA